MGRTILLERRQSESVGRRNSRTTFLRSDWPRPFARREVGVEMELGRSENKRPEEKGKISREGTVASSIRSVLLIPVDMMSSTDWSERTVVTEQQPPNSPSRIIAGDDHIAEFSDLFREAIQARNVYAAWARKLTNARPNDPKLQSYHQEVTKAGESVELLLVKLNVPLFRIPASEKELDRIVLRVKNRVSDPPAEKNEEEKKPAAVPPPPSSPRSKGRKGKRSVDADGFAPPPKQLVRKVLSTSPPSPPFRAIS
ncbi:hypothetical protein TNCV_3852781 [Trichonephila clavipes]|nr:hypothetical protein TNCV_3852781 [Trichonephila clavipes]